MNHAATIAGTVPEDKGVNGTAQVVFGEEHGSGSTIDCGNYIGGILTRSNVYLDEGSIVSDGEVLLEF